MANGTRIAPTIDGIPTYLSVTIRFIDFTGDKRAVTIRAKAAATPAEIEALVAATQLGSNASIYEVRVNDVYAGVPQAADALEAVWENVQDNIVLQLKDPTSSIRNFVPSPVEGWFTNGTENVDPVNAEFVAWKIATENVVELAYQAVSVRLTQRRDTNPSQPI